MPIKINNGEWPEGSVKVMPRIKEPEPEPKLCVMCGSPVPTRRHKYCCKICAYMAHREKAPEEIKQYIIKRFTIRSIRKMYVAKCIVDPEDAIEFRKQVEEEDGEEFAEMMLDGINPETVDVERYAASRDKELKKAQISKYQRKKKSMATIT